MSDSLLAPLDTLIAAQPARAAVSHACSCARCRSSGATTRLRARSTAGCATPRDAAPYREYARLLSSSDSRRRPTASSRAAGVALGHRRSDLQLEIAQLRAAMGSGRRARSAWRRALVDAPHLAQAAAYALAPTPAALRDRDPRDPALAPPVERGARARSPSSR